VALTDRFVVQSMLTLLAVMLLLAGLIGFYAFQSREAGRLGAIGFSIAFFVTALMVGDFYAHTFVTPTLAIDIPRPARRRASHEPFVVRAAPRHPCPDLVSVGDHLLDGEAEGREGVAKEADRSLELLSCGSQAEVVLDIAWGKRSPRVADCPC
jgi:hypothetical protein